MHNLVRFGKAFSPEARAAALEARRAKGKGPQQAPATLRDMVEATEARDRATLAQRADEAATASYTVGSSKDAQVTVDTSDRTEVKATTEVPQTFRYSPPDTKGIFVPTAYRSIDYSSSMLREKYGEVRGENMYQSMIDMRGNSGARPFVVHNKIVAEKMAMMQKLGKLGNPENHHYQGLYRKYREKSVKEAGTVKYKPGGDLVGGATKPGWANTSRQQMRAGKKMH